MPENARARTTLLLKLAGTVVLAGLLVAGLMFPLIGGSGLVARNSASLLDALPSELTDRTPAGNTKVVAADGSLVTEFYTNNRTSVTGDQIAAVMKQAQVDIEDSRFYEHNGLDVQGTLRALARNVAAGSVRQGGSTLTQQLVKQTLLQTAATPQERQAATEESVGRKLREARLALALEQKYSKDEILTRYLNIVYFGQGAYGIQSAAQTYFSVNAADLTLPQAALLAGLVQSPTNDDPIQHPEAAKTRRDEVLNRMHQLGHLSNQQLAETLTIPVQVVPGQKPPNGCINAAVGGFYCAYLKSYLTNTLGLADSEIADRGLTIQTSLRPDMQVAGDQAVLNTLPMGAELAGMYTAVEPGTGHVLAMSVNRRYGCSDPDCESVVLNTAASQGSGSTYKVFTAAYALQQGYSQNYTLTTGNHYTSHVYKDGTGWYDVSNAGNYPGTLDMVKALYMSSNTYFVGLEDALGSVEGPVRTAQAMGLHSLDPVADKVIAEKRGSFTLGAEATSPLDLASAYSTLAASGTQCDPTPVVQILGTDGQPLTGGDGQPVVKNDKCHPNAIPQGVATTVNQILRKDVEPGNPGQTAERAYVPGHQIAGKTGTSQNNWSAAFVGYTPEYVASVMVLNPKKNQNVGGFGGNKPATIWHDAMAPILDAGPTAEFPPADPTVADGNTRLVPDCSSVSDCKSALQSAGFRSTTASVDSDQQRGTFVGLNPPSGSRATQHQTITIQVSNGSAYQPPAQNPAPPADQNPAPPADQSTGGNGNGGNGGNGTGGNGNGG